MSVTLLPCYLRDQLRPTIPYPTGTVLSKDAVPGTSCLATIMLSLRDKSHSPIEGPRIKLALMGLKPQASECRRPDLSRSSIGLSFDGAPHRPSGQVFLHKKSQQNHRNHGHRRRGAALP